MNTTLFENVQRYILEIYQEFMFGLVDDDVADIGMFIAELRGSYHLQYLHADEPVKALWRRIEGNAAVAEFVVRGSIHFKARLLALSAYDTWKSVIIGAYSELFGNFDRRKDAIVSQSYWEKQATRDYLGRVLNEETWLLFVLTIELCISKLGASDGSQTTT